MAFNGSGTYVLYTPGNPVVTGTTISSTWANNTLNDIATGLSTCLTKDGQSTPTAGIKFYAGTVSLPGIYLSTDTSTGLYRVSANVYGFAVSGAQVWRIASSGTFITGIVGATGNIYSGASRSSTTGFVRSMNIEGTDASLQLYQTTTGTSWEIGNDSTGLFRILNAGNNRVTMTAAGNMTLAASLARPIVTETTAARTVLATDSHIIVNFAGTCTLTLPAAATFPGREITVRTITANGVVSASSDVVPLIGGAAGTAILAGAAGRWALLVSDGTNWQIQSGVT